MHILKFTEKILTFRKKLQIWKIKLMKVISVIAFPYWTSLNIQWNQFFLQFKIFFETPYHSLSNGSKYSLETKFKFEFKTNLEQRNHQDLSLQKNNFLSCCLVIKLNLKLFCMKLSDLRILVKDKYPPLRCKAPRIKIPFALFCLCQAEF